MRPTPYSSYSSKTAYIVDLMVTFVIPLFYASENHKRQFSSFLRQQPDKALYLETCQALYDLLIDRNDNRKEDLIFQTRELKKETKYVNAAYANHHAVARLAYQTNQSVTFSEKLNCTA